MEPSVKTYQILSFDRSRVLGTVEAESATLAARAWVEREHGEGQSWVFRTYDHDRRMIVWRALDQKRTIDPEHYWRDFWKPIGEPFHLSPEH